VSARDSGKVMLDAVLGEVIVTCEKLHWLVHEAEQYLRPEQRAAGVLVRRRERVHAHDAAGPRWRAWHAAARPRCMRLGSLPWRVWPRHCRCAGWRR
jgi:hypothetical protein